MHRMKASDYYYEYSKLQGSLNHLEEKINNRLTFLLDKYKDENPTVIINGWDKKTIQEIISLDPINRYDINKIIHIIDAIEKWIETKETFIQLSIFDNLK
ncbi:MAG: hypothetical protein ACOC22_03130 [bacterium]